MVPVVCGALSVFVVCCLCSCGACCRLAGDLGVMSKFVEC